jgi:hypothetical protein
MMRSTHAVCTVGVNMKLTCFVKYYKESNKNFIVLTFCILVYKPLACGYLKEIDSCICNR